MEQNDAQIMGTRDTDLSSPAGCAIAGGGDDRARRNAGNPIADKAARLKARRAKKREDHEREMDQRIDETMNALRMDLEAFCERHFVLGATHRAPCVSGGGRTLGMTGDGPRDGPREESRCLIGGSLPRMQVESSGKSPLASGMVSLAGLHGLSLRDGSSPSVGRQGQDLDDVGDRGEHCDGNRDSWAAFCRVCSSAGLDPLLLYHSVSLKQASNGMGGSFIGLDSPVYSKYLNALSVVVLDVCDAQRVLTGGLCPLDRLVERVRRRGGAWLHGRGVEKVQEDVLRAVDAMRVALVGSGVSPGSSVGVIVISGRAYVSTVDFIMDGDCIELLQLFQMAREGITRREAMDNLKWTEERVVDALQKLMRDGIVWLDLPPEAMPPLYWCLCMT